MLQMDLFGGEDMLILSDPAPPPPPPAPEPREVQFDLFGTPEGQFFGQTDILAWSESE